MTIREKLKIGKKVIKERIRELKEKKNEAVKFSAYSWIYLARLEELNFALGVVNDLYYDIVGESDSEDEE